MTELPKPYYEDDAVTIYHGDCREILPHLPKVDLVLTDPPYGLGNRWTGGTWGSAEMYADAKRWDQRPSCELISEIVRHGENAILWGGNYFSMPPCRGFLLWIKVPSLATMADAEFAWSSYDHVAKSFSSHRNPDGKREHPTEKPLRLITWSIEFATSRGEVNSILDPFMGSGTTGVACAKLGRTFIGIEIERKYFDIAVRRIDAELRQGKLFEPERPKVEQLELIKADSVR